MNNERRTFWPLLGVLLLLLTATLLLILKLERHPSMQRPMPDVTYQQHWELDDVLEAVLYLMRKNRLNEAQSLLTAALLKYPDNSDIWMLRGSVYYRQDRFDQAAHAFAMVQKYQPDNAAASNNLAESLIQLKRFGEARTAIDKAAELAPENGEIMLNAAGIYALMKDDKSALQYLKRALENGVVPEKVTDHPELIRLLERPEFMNYYHARQKDNQQKK